MSEYILALTTPATHASIFEPRAADWDVDVRNVQSPGDALQLLGAEDACRLILVEREIASQLRGVVERLRRADPAAEILLLSAAVSEPVRGELQALGAELLDRGSSPDELQHEVRRRFERASFQARVGILGHSPRIHEVLETILHIGPTDIPVLVTGPSGSGKELVARAVYTVSRRSDKAFVALNVGALAESVLESELFGHERGAFTGAVSRRAGVFERASGGTLFLDEVGEMSPHMQVRLLRVLESGEITPVGGTRPMHVDVRVLAATNQRLEDAVRRGSFREDLYYRLKVVHIEVPALAARREDLPQLVDHFLGESARLYGTRAQGISEGALRSLQEYTWPGNVRELRNVVFRMAVLAKGRRLEERDVPADIRHPVAATQLPVPAHRSHEQAERDIVLQSLLALRHDLQEVLGLLRRREEPSSAVVVEPEPPLPQSGPRNLRETEKETIRAALEEVGGNRRLAARRLGIAERTLYRKIKEYGLS